MENSIGKHGIKISDKVKMKQLLASVYGRATKWTLSCSDISNAMKNAEKELDIAGVVESRRPGIIANIKSGGPAKRGSQFSSSVYGTKAVLRRYKEGWRLMQVEKVTVYDGQKFSREFLIDAAEIEAIKNRAVKQFHAIPAELSA